MFKPVFAYNVSLDEATAYANFIQNLTRNSISKNKAESVCVYGNDQVARSLLKNPNSFVLSTNKIEEARRCKSVYIVFDNVSGIKNYLNLLTANKILTISIFEEFVENGGMIQVQMGRRDFELIVDVKALNSAQIKLDTLSTNLIVN